jgi:diacylglycerol kinase family enzyme
MLDVVVIRRFPKILGATIAVRGLTGTLYSSPFVRHYRGREITITNPSLNLMQSDGDAHSCESTVHFRVLPGGQTIIVP